MYTDKIIVCKQFETNVNMNLEEAVRSLSHLNTDEDKGLLTSFPQPLPAEVPKQGEKGATT